MSEAPDEPTGDDTQSEAETADVVEGDEGSDATDEASDD